MEQLQLSDFELLFGKNLNVDFASISLSTLNKYAKKFKINRRINMIRFMAQCKHEIQFLNTPYGRVPRLEENLNFRDEILILLSAYWRNHQKKLQEVRKLPKKEQIKIIMNRWYNRAVSGNRIGSNDGRLYVGHGALMVTGRYNTIKCLKHIENVTGIKCLDEHSEPLNGVFKRYDIFWLLGMAFWDLNRMLGCSGTDDCTDIVNGGLPEKFKEERLATAIRLDNSSFLS